MQPDPVHLRVSIEASVGRLVLARPAKLNTLNRGLLEELARAAAWFDEQAGVKVVVISGEGRAFSAGFDLSDPSWNELGPPEQSAMVGRAMAEAIGGMQAITIASIHGHCVGGAVVLASACDLRVVAAGAMFRIPEVDLGIPLFWTGVPRLIRELGPALTKELILTGRAFGAAEAHAIRFVNRVVSDDELHSHTSALAAELAAKPALLLRMTKQQVESAAPSVPLTDEGGGRDVADLAVAFADAESREVAAAYMRRLHQKA